MSEMAYARQDHRHIVSVSCFNHRLIVDGTAGLNNRADARLTGDFDTVWEWEIGIRG